jgi:hypothetical protein
MSHLNVIPSGRYRTDEGPRTADEITAPNRLIRRYSAIAQLALIAFSTLLISACRSPGSQPAPGAVFTPKPTTAPLQSSPPAPTITAVPASDYELGALQLPEGVVLFISNHTWRVCTNECDCPAVEGLRRGYEIRDDRLYLSRFGMDQSWENETLPAIVLAHGDFEEALVAIEHLPFVPKGDFPILATMADGAVVYEWNGNAYQLAAGEVWQVARSIDYGGGCVMTDYSSLRKHGVWSNDRIIMYN